MDSAAGAVNARKHLDGNDRVVCEKDTIFGDNRAIYAVRTLACGIISSTESREDELVDQEV
jgi:hypothetical protein